MGRNSFKIGCQWNPAKIDYGRSPEVLLCKEEIGPDIYRTKNELEVE